MEKMFGQMMQEFFSGMSEEDKQNTRARFGKMAEKCPCMGGNEMPEEDKKKMLEKMMSCCGGVMERMSDRFKKTDPPSAEAGSSDRA